MARNEYHKSKFAKALVNRINPALERFCSNPDHSRFERDAPPLFVRSPEGLSIWRVPGMAAATPDDGSYERKMEELFAPHLDNMEQEIALDTAQGIRLYHPSAVYAREEKFEMHRMANSVDFCRHKYVEGASGVRRLRVLARRNIRKRWKKMGVWNPAWGIPCREPSEPNDSTWDWRWEWQHGEFAVKATSISSHAAKTHPIASALLSRQELQFGECRYPPPLSHLTEQTSPSEAVSFIASRPWFVFGIEKTEWETRLLRLPTVRDKKYVPSVPLLWQNRGDQRLKNDSSKPRLPIGWKWRHESPSPDHEDATWKWLPDSGPAWDTSAARENIHLDHDAMELTPSEIDVIESLDPRPLSPEPQIADASDKFQQTLNPAREMPPSQAPEPENPAQPRRSPRFLAKEPDAMPPKAPTESGNPSHTKRSRLSEKTSAAEPPSNINKPRAKTDTPSTKLSSRPPKTANKSQPPSGVSKPPIKTDTPATKRRGRPSKTAELAESSLRIPRPTVLYKNPEAQPRGRPAKTIALSQSPSDIPDSTAPSKKAQPKRRGRSPKATRLTRPPPNTLEPAALPTKIQAKPKGRPPKAAGQAQPQPGARKTPSKTEKSATKRSGRPSNTTGLTKRPSGISKPTARSKKRQAKPKEGPLLALLMEDKQPPGKTADRKTARAIDKPGDVVQTKNTPPEKENRLSLKPTVGAAPSQKRKRGQHKNCDAQEPLDTIVVQLNDSVEALGRDQTTPLVGTRRSERIKDREKKKQRIG